MSKRLGMKVGLAAAGILLALGAIAPGRTVTAAAPPGRYLVTTHTVVDTATGLTWQRVPPASTYTWADADDYCRTLSLAGAGGWRLPAYKELSSLIDEGTHDPAIDPTAFPGTPNEHFWTATRHAAAATGRWGVKFADGSAESREVTLAIRVRCVKAGP